MTREELAQRIYLRWYRDGASKWEYCHSSPERFPISERVWVEAAYQAAEVLAEVLAEAYTPMVTAR